MGVIGDFFGGILDWAGSGILEAAIFGVVAVFGLLVVFLLARFAVALSNDHDVNESARITGGWFAVILGAVVGLITMGLASTGMFGGVLVDVLGSNPTLFAGAIPTSLGAALSLGWLDLSTSQYVGLSMMLVFGVMFIREVKSRNDRLS